MADGVLLIGAGGLGCGAALALAAAGVQRLGVVDDDVVDDTNLHRQILHAPGSVGRSKLESMRGTLSGLFPSTQLVLHPGRFDAASAANLLRGYAVVVDGSDNLGTKFLANDAAVLARVPLVHAASVGTFGQLLTVPAGGRPCYRCLFEDLPPAGSDAGLSCAEAGVLGPVPGVIGALAAHEAWTLLCGKTPAFSGRLFRYDSQPMTTRTITFRPNPGCKVCGAAPVIRSLDPTAYAPDSCA